MLQEEKDRLEERIVAYFEGSLSKQESRTLLSEVEKSTESRALFKAHESLNSLISAARVPMEAPLEVKRSIAERIPGLLAFIPGLLGGAEALPVLTQNGGWFSFLTKIPLSTAISVGTSVAVLTTAGVIVKNNIDKNNEAKERAAHVTQVQPKANANDQQYTMASPAERNMTVPNLGSTGANAVDAGTANGGAGSMNVGSGATNVGTGSANAGAGVAGGAANTATANIGNAGGGNAIVDKANAGVGSGVGNEVNSHNRVAIHKDNAHSDAASGNKNIAEKGANSRDIENRQNFGNNRDLRHTQSTQTPATVTPRTTTPEVEQRAEPQDVTPEIHSIAGLPGEPIAKANAIPRFSPVTALPIENDGSWGVRPFAIGGARMLFAPSVSGKNIDPSAQGFSGVTTSASYGWGMDFDLTPSVALEMKMGWSQFVQIQGMQPIEDVNSALSGVPLYTKYSTTRLTDNTIWTTAGATYAFDIASSLRILANVETGAAWLYPAPALILGGGLAAEIPLSSHLGVRPGVTYDATWVQATDMGNGNLPITNYRLVDRQFTNGGTLLNSSLGITIGLTYRY